VAESSSERAQRSYGSACPGCGAPVRFLSLGSTHAVCGYCHSTLVRDGESLTRIGKMAEVFDDFSPLQLMAQGKKNGLGFTVVGRLQFQYDEGRWTEWLCALDDGGAAWLSEDNGGFVWATASKSNTALPPADKWVVGKPFQINGKPFAIASVTQASLVAAQGELPKLPELGVPFTVVEARGTSGAAAEVVSIDYSSEPPQVSLGTPVLLDDLQLTGLKDAQAQGGSDRAVQSRHFNCPNCGSALEVKLAQTQSLSCPSCESLIDLSQGIGGELRHAIQDEPVQPLIPLGSQGTLVGRNWQVVGYQHRTGQEPDDPDETFGWEEYLLYNAKAGFAFLVDSTDGWSLVKPTTGSPTQLAGSPDVQYAGKRYQLLYRYKAETSYVAGEFYWQVKRGQQTVNSDYSDGGKLTLSSEQSGQEITWSAGHVVDHRTVAKAFDQEGRTDLFRRGDAQPLSSMLTNLDTSGTWTQITIWVIIVLVIVLMERCTNDCDPRVENCTSSTRSGGGSFGGYSSGGGHK
jgi:hypothetical protein